MNKTMPNLFLIGAQKGGSTSLYDILVSHPSVGQLTQKEPNIFSVPTIQEAREQLAQQQLPSPLPRYVIDASVDYSRSPLYPNTAENIFQILGDDVHFIYVMRNPVERLISNYYWIVQRYGEPRDLHKLIADEPQYIATGQYDLQLESYLRFFSPKKIHCIVFETFVADKAGTLDALAKHLDLDSAGFTATAAHRGATNKKMTRRARFGPLNELIWRSKSLKSFARKVIPERMIRQIAEAMTVSEERSEMSNAQKLELYETYYADSVQKVQSMTGLDLAHWKNSYLSG